MLTHETWKLCDLLVCVSEFHVCCCLLQRVVSDAACCELYENILSSQEAKNAKKEKAKLEKSGEKKGDKDKKAEREAKKVSIPLPTKHNI